MPLTSAPSALVTIREKDPVSTNVQAVFLPAMLAKLRHSLCLDSQALKHTGADWENPAQLRFVMTEGKKRQVRRLCKLAGLKRVRIGCVVLGNLSQGQRRYLAPHEKF